MARRKNEVTTEIRDVTPGVAERWYGRNIRNRNVNQSKVNEFAEAMRRGEWKLNGQSIGFDRDGNLIDGQHRLLACMLSGATFQTVVVHNLEPEAQATIDIGTKRTLGSFLTMRGETNGGDLGSALTFLHRLEVKDLRNVALRPTPLEAFELLDRHPGIRESVPYGRALGKAVGGQRGMYTFLHYHFSTFDSYEADRFFNGLTTGEMLQRGEPVYVLRNTLLKDRSDRKSKLSSTYKLAIFIKAWNFHHDGATIKVLRWNATGEGAEAWPEAK